MMNFTKGDMLVITGMTAMVEEEGLTPHDAIERVRSIENQIFHALLQIQEEAKNK